MERRRPVSGLERHSEQRPDALDRRGRPRHASFRNPSGNSNGNTFDYEGRQISCEHGGRRVVRYEHNGTVTVIADKFDGKRLNSPNDVVVHPGRRHLVHRSDATASAATTKGTRASRRSKEAVYRVDPQDAARSRRSPTSSSSPNGLCFSPDYKKLYIADTGHGPRDITVYDVDGKTLRNGKRFVQLDIPGTGAPSAADGIRCDVDGNIWAGARPGVQVDRRRRRAHRDDSLPETCANVCFGGASATACSWRRASRSTPSTSKRKAHSSPERLTPCRAAVPQGISVTLRRGWGPAAIGKERHTWAPSCTAVETRST